MSVLGVFREKPGPQIAPGRTVTRFTPSSPASFHARCSATVFARRYGTRKSSVQFSSVDGDAPGAVSGTVTTEEVRTTFDGGCADGVGRAFDARPDDFLLFASARNDIGVDGGEMEKEIDAVERRPQLLGFIEVDFDDIERAKRAQRFDLVRVGKRTDGGANLVAAFQQRLAEIETEMAVGAGYEDMHGSPLCAP